MIKYSCPKCSVLLESSSSLAGHYDQCPVCHTKVSVPVSTSSGRGLWWAIGGAAVAIIGACVVVLLWPKTAPLSNPESQVGTVQPEIHLPPSPMKEQVTKGPPVRFENPVQKPSITPGPATVPVAPTPAIVQPPVKPPLPNPPQTPPTRVGLHAIVSRQLLFGGYALAVYQDGKQIYRQQIVSDIGTPGPLNQGFASWEEKGNKVEVSHSGGLFKVVWNGKEIPCNPK